MKHLLIAMTLFALVGIVVFAGQTPAPQTPAPSADPYANNAAPARPSSRWPAPAGKDSGAMMTAPAGAVNQGPFDPGDLEVRHRVQSAARARRSGIR